MEKENQSPQSMGHSEEQLASADDAPKFGRLLLVLFAAVLVVVVITFVSEAYYS